MKFYNEEERELYESIQKNDNQPVVISHDENIKLKAIASNTIAQRKIRKPISLRIVEDDILLIKKQAKKEGMPYQTLIQSILHKYVTNQLKSV